jgi:hypothetical protein
MAVYENGQWTFAHPNCPLCNIIRRNQGFSVVIDETQPICPPCSEVKAYEAYVASAPYQAWLLTTPKEFNIEWYLANPPPPRAQ